MGKGLWKNPRSDPASGGAPVLLYEFPFNESVRTLLRLEHLFDRLGQLVTRDSAIDHHFAIVTLFGSVGGQCSIGPQERDAQGVGAPQGPIQQLPRQPRRVGRRSRRHRAAVWTLLSRLSTRQTGKAGAGLASNDMLMGVKSRLAIPGGTCEFRPPSLPRLAATQCRAATAGPAAMDEQRGTHGPSGCPASIAAQETGSPHKVAAQGGVYQQSLSGAKQHQLLRLRIADTWAWCQRSSATA